MEEPVIDTIETPAKREHYDTTSELYGSFHVCDSEFAIAVSQLQEVVDTPEQFTKMPLSPEYLLGLFNLRGIIIPVIDLRLFLELKSSNPNIKDRKIGILELQGNLIGLILDKTGEVFRSTPEERSNFSDKDRHQIISGVFKKDNGKRLIQIINVQNLMKVKTIPKQDHSSIRQQQDLALLKGVRKQCISFLIGKSLYALDIEAIQEIIKIDKINESALAVSHCIGTIDVRGTTVPLINFSALLGFETQEDTSSYSLADQSVIVMKIGAECFGLLVDSVDSIISYFENELKIFPILSNSRAKMFGGCIVLPNQAHALLLNCDYILSNEEIIAITHGHSALYTQNAELKRNNAREKRITFITFILEKTYAIPITEVKEIIDEPDNLLEAVGLPEFCKGIMNLRGEMFIIIDGEKLYHKKKSNSTNKKVLVFKGSSLNYGLIVDSVEEIITLPESSKIKLNQVTSDAEQKTHQHKNEALQIHDKDNKIKSVLIMHPESIEYTIKSSIT
jgi:purine-binding chemotaxis protein CheW